MRRGKRMFVWLLAVTLVVLIAAALGQHYRFGHLRPGQRAEELRFIASSSSWTDRQFCGLFGLCGVHHLKGAGWATLPLQSLFSPDDDTAHEEGEGDQYEDFWSSGTDDPAAWSDTERVLRDIPQFVFDHAPLIHLYSGETYWPGDIAEHLQHTTPFFNYTPATTERRHENLSTLDQLNEYGRGVFLHSDDNIEELPEWLRGIKNVPRPVPAAVVDEHPPPLASLPYDDELKVDTSTNNASWVKAGISESSDPADVSFPSAIKLDSSSNNIDADPPAPRVVGRSRAPAILIVVAKEDGVVDAFWFFFYSYNLGNSVLGVRFGNHVGDWEHTCVRFEHGEPRAVYFSEHSGGEAYSYAAVEKIGKRPVGYSATGTHALYATPGEHRYILPLGLLHDVTDRGPLWDPALNVRSYVYNRTGRELRAASATPRVPLAWFDYKGHWGDRAYPLADTRQYRLAGQYHYVSGPAGPMYKNLGREHICWSRGECRIKERIDDVDDAEAAGGR